MLKLDPSPFLMLAIPMVVLPAFVTHRGLVRNEFRAPARSGWHHYSTGSWSWWSGTITNFVFLSVSAFLLYETMFDGSGFSREPVLPMPALTGTLIASERSDRTSREVANCLSGGEDRNLYALAPDSWVYAERNGRNQTMYTFEIVPDRVGSRVDVRRVQVSPFVTWKRCLA
jgi:hypothetical protein